MKTGRPEKNDVKRKKNDYRRANENKMNILGIQKKRRCWENEKLGLIISVGVLSNSISVLSSSMKITQIDEERIETNA